MLNDAMRKAVDRACQDIAAARKATEVTDHDVEEFDAELNEMCEKWHGRFKDMNIAEFTMFLISDLVDMNIELVGKENDDGDK